MVATIFNENEIEHDYSGLVFAICDMKRGKKIQMGGAKIRNFFH